MRPGTEPSMRSRRACAAPPSRPRRASSIRCWAQWLAAHRASMTRTVGTPHEIEPDTFLGVESALGVGELRVAHVCAQCVADQFPHALVWEPCAAEWLVGVFLWAAAPPAALPGPLAALSSRRDPCAQRNTRQEKTNRSLQPIFLFEDTAPTESIPPTPRGAESTLDTPQRTAGAPREHRHPEISPASPPRAHSLHRAVRR